MPFSKRNYYSLRQAIVARCHATQTGRCMSNKIITWRREELELDEKSGFPRVYKHTHTHTHTHMHTHTQTHTHTRTRASSRNDEHATETNVSSSMGRGQLLVTLRNYEKLWKQFQKRGVCKLMIKFWVELRGLFIFVRLSQIILRACPKNNCQDTLYENVTNS